MKTATSFFFHVKLLVFLFLVNTCTAVTAQDQSLSSLTIKTTHIVPKDSTETYSEVILDKNSSHLTVEGTLIIYGNLNMNGNDSELTIKKGSVVIVYGNVYAANQVSMSADSYFVVYGNFTRKTGSTHGETDFDPEMVYIFGEVDDEWQIGECEDTTGETCDYKDEEDFLKDDLDDLQEALNCLNIPEISDVITCEGQTAVLAQGITIPEASTFQWQEKNSDSLWVNRVNDTLVSLSIPNVQPPMNGTKYRLIARSTGVCKMGISRAITLTVEEPIVIGEITGPAEVCGNGSFTYTLTGAQPDVEYSWQVPSDWTFEELSTSGISVNPGTVSGEIKVSGPASCGATFERVLWVDAKVAGRWTGSKNSLWEDPLNWDCKILPTSSTAVTIPLNSVNYPVVNEGVIGLSNNITIEDGAFFNVMGDLDISGTISGTLNAQAGTIKFSGSVPQAIPSTAFTGNLVENIVVNNPSQVNLEGPLKVSGVVKTTQGNLISSGFLTLVSDKDRTALISGTGSGNVVGIINLQRFLEPAFGYKYFSSPLKGTTVADFDAYIDLQDPTTGFPHFYQYVENREDSSGNDLTGWKSYITPSLPLNLLEGYAVNFGESGGPVTLTLSGEVNNGPQSRILTNNNGVYTKGFNLVGNPYPSPIDWDKVAGWTKVNIDDAVYFFNASSSDPYTGTYSSYIENGPSSDGKTTSIIPSMQGFFVHVSDGSTQGTLGVTHQARVEDQTQVFHKNAAARFPLLRISAGFSKEKLSDPTVIYFTPTAETTFDKRLDALKLMNTNPGVPSFYSLSPEKQELSINALPNALQNDLIRIPLGYSALKAGNIQIRLQDLENLPLDLKVYLVDLEKNVYTDLQKENYYTTQISKGSSNNRFELVLSKEAITDSKILNLPMSVVASKEKISISLNLETGAQAEVVVSSLSGQVLRSFTGTSQDTLEIDGIKSAGVYIISLVSGETRYSKKILIN